MTQSPDATSPFTVEVEAGDGLVRLRCSGELDIATADRLQSALDGAGLTAGQNLIIDLSEVGFMDSTGLRLLITADRAAEEADYRLTVVTGDSPAKRVLELTRMDDHIRVVSSLD